MLIKLSTWGLRVQSSVPKRMVRLCEGSLITARGRCHQPLVIYLWFTGLQAVGIKAAGLGRSEER